MRRRGVGTAAPQTAEAGVEVLDGEQLRLVLTCRLPHPTIQGEHHAIHATDL